MRRMGGAGRSEGSVIMRQVRSITADQAAINVKTSKVILQVANVVSSMNCDSTGAANSIYIRSYF